MSLMYFKNILFIFSLKKIFCYFFKIWPAKTYVVPRKQNIAGCRARKDPFWGVFSGAANRARHVLAGPSGV